MTPFDKALAAGIRFAQERYARAIEALATLIKEVAGKARRNVEEEINALPGKRLFFTPVKTQLFTSASVTTDPFGNLLLFQLPKDGWFVMTHYPSVIWRITASGTAADVGKWRPASSWPLPTDTLGTDYADVSLSFRDGGPERWLNSAAQLRDSVGAPIPDFLKHVPSGMCSNPLTLKRLPVPTLFRPKSVLACSPRYDAVTFSEASEGRLVVALPGYKISNS